VTPLHLAHPRDLGALFRDSLRVYWRHLWAFLLLGAAVVVPVQLVVHGIGLEQLTGPYDPSPPVAEALVVVAVSFLVTGPLVTAVCIYALRRVADGDPPGARQSLLSGLEAFTPLFFAVALAAVGIAVGMLLLVVPGLYLLVRWWFVPQAVVLERAQGPEALRRSADGVSGHWWRTAGMLLAVNLATLVPALVLGAPFTGIADSSGDAAWELAGSMLTETVTAPFSAIFSTLLWFDLRSRGSLRAI
jgi:hypothetical protein